jgi:hypothetical protein
MQWTIAGRKYKPRIAQVIDAPTVERLLIAKHPDDLQPIIDLGHICHLLSPNRVNQQSSFYLG